MKFKVGDLVEPNKKFLDHKYRPFGYYVAEVIDVHEDAKPTMVQMKNIFNGYEFWQTIEYIQPHIHTSPCHCHHHCCCCKCGENEADKPLAEKLLLITNTELVKKLNLEKLQVASMQEKLDFEENLRRKEIELCVCLKEKIFNLERELYASKLPDPFCPYPVFGETKDEKKSRKRLDKLEDKLRRIKNILS